MALIRPDERRFWCDRHYPAFGSRSSLPPAAARPGFVSPVRNFEGTAFEFERGMQALGFNEIHPQQAAVQRVVDSRNEDGSILYPIVSVDEPRRSGKSESTYAIALGRCLERQGYRVALTFATTGTKAAQRFKSDIFDRLTRWAEAHGVDLTTIRSNGHEGIKFGGTDSVLMILPPKGDAFRSEAFDLALVDEAGEASAALTATLLESILPTMDTREDAQLIVAGTPPSFRTGNLLWDFENAARTGTDPEVGAVFYGVPRDLTIEDVETWEQVEPLLLRHHPGIGTLTTLPKMQRNYRVMGPARFAREYLGQAGRDQATAGIINPAKWNDGLEDAAFPELPAHFAVGFGVSHDQAFGCMAVAWRDKRGRAVLGLLEYDSGTAWLPERVNELATKHPRIPIGHDSRGSVVPEAEKVKQLRPRTKLHPMSWPHVQSAAMGLVREIHRGNVVHYGQDFLTDAALSAVRRGEERGFAFGRPSDGVSQIVALEAASVALWLYDQNPAPQRRVAVTV